MADDSFDWTFGGSWPHAPRWFDTPQGRMHFVDVGARHHPPLVLIHGNPTWGYLYRHLIPPALAAGHRVIVPDHLGFGRSDQPDAPAHHAIEEHARRLDALLESLDLREATLAVHDWGGPIGLFWATRHPQRVRQLVLFNTFGHPPRARIRLPLPLRLFRVPGLGELLVKGLHAVVRGFLFGAGTVRRDRLTAEVRAAYLAPHRRWSSRAAVLALARQFPAGPGGITASFFERVHRQLGVLAGTRVLIAWAGQDVLLGEAELRLWQQDFPGAELLRLPESGHFLQEDAAEILAPAVLRFLAGGAATDGESRAGAVVEKAS